MKNVLFACESQMGEKVTNKYLAKSNLLFAYHEKRKRENELWALQKYRLCASGYPVAEPALQNTPISCC